MVDARLPERYLADRRILRLTDAERSGLFVATLWSVSNRTDGRIERGDLALIPMFRAEVVTTLVVHGLWIEDGPDAWLIAEYGRDQTSRDELEVLENARRRDREKKRRQRSENSTSPRGRSRGTVPGDSTGKDRTGKAGQEGEEVSANATTGVVSEWPVRVPGGEWTDEEPW